jgi:hypothetical protein
MLTNGILERLVERQAEIEVLQRRCAELRQETETLCQRLIEARASSQHTVEQTRSIIAESFRLIAALPRETALISSAYNAALHAEPDSSSQ